MFNHTQKLTSLIWSYLLYGQFSLDKIADHISDPHCMCVLPFGWLLRPCWPPNKPWGHIWPQMKLSGLNYLCSYVSVVCQCFYLIKFRRRKKVYHPVTRGAQPAPLVKQEWCLGFIYLSNSIPAPWVDRRPWGPPTSPPPPATSPRRVASWCGSWSLRTRICNRDSGGSCRDRCTLS